MRDATNALASVFLIGLIPMLFSGDLYWSMALYCREMQVVIITALSLVSLPKHQVGIKTALLVFLIYSVVESHLYLIQEFFSYDVYGASWCIYSAIFVLIYSFNRNKQFHFESDKIKKPENIHLCFWKPKEVRHLLPTLIGCCFGGLSVYTDFHIYSFRGVFVKREVRESIVGRAYTVIDTGISKREVKDKLNSLIGQPAGLLGVKCIFILKPVLSSLGEKFRVKSWLDLIPSLYSMRIPLWKKTLG